MIPTGLYACYGVQSPQGSNKTLWIVKTFVINRGEVNDQTRTHRLGIQKAKK